VFHDVVTKHDIKTVVFEWNLVEVKMQIGDRRNEVCGKVMEVFLRLEAIDEALLWRHVQDRKLGLCEEFAVVFEIQPHEAVALKSEVVGAKDVVAVGYIRAVRKKFGKGFVADWAMNVVAFVKCRRKKSKNITEPNKKRTR
jgi:hypothetical protein